MFTVRELHGKTRIQDLLLQELETGKNLAQLKKITDSYVAKFYALKKLYYLNGGSSKIEKLA